MIKKLFLVGVVAAIAVVAVKGTGVVKGLRSEYESVKQVWKGSESPEKQIEKLRGEVSKLDADVNKVKDELAREIVECRDLQRQAGKVRTEVDADQARVVAFGKELDAATKQVSYGRETLSIPDAKERLKSDVNFLVKKKQTLAVLEKTLSHRERAREILEKQLDELQRQKLTLKTEIDAIEVEYKALKLSQIENKYQKDDSRLSNIKQTLDKLRKDLEVNQERLKLDPVVQEGTPAASTESVSDILAPLEKK
jgi:chromosome segregation ATPase